MKFENEFLNVVDGATSQVEELYQARLKKFTDELADLQNRLDLAKKDLDTKTKLIPKIKDERRASFIQGQVNSLKGQIKQINDSITNKQKEIDSLKSEYSYLPSQQTKEIEQAATNAATLTQDEYGKIVKTQVEIVQQKKESEKVKIFMGVGVGLVTLLILFKTIK